MNAADRPLIEKLQHVVDTQVGAIGSGCAIPDCCTTPCRSRYAEEALASAKAAARMTPRSSHISPMSPSAGTAMTHQGVKFSLASTEPNLSIFGGVQTDAYDSSSGASWMNGGLGTGSAAPQQRNALEDSSRRSVDVSQSILHSMASPLQILHRGASLQDRVDDGFLGGSNHGIGRQQPSQSILHSSASPLQILHQGASLQDQIEDELLGSSNHGIGRQQHMHDDRIKERQHLDKRGRDEWLETSSQDGARARTRFASDKVSNMLPCSAPHILAQGENTCNQNICIRSVNVLCLTGV